MKRLIGTAILFIVVLVVIWGWAYIEICKLFFENKTGGI